MVVIVEQIILQDINSVLVAYLLLDEFITFTRDERLNGYHTLTIEIPIEHRQISSFVKYNRLVFKDKTLNKWYEFVIKTIEKTDSSLKATCESSLYDTLYSFVDFVSFNSNLIMSGLTQILNAAVPTSSWQVGTSDIAGYYNLQATRKNLKQVLWEYLENTNGFIEERIEVSNGVITGRYIDILSKRGTDRGKVIYDDREISEINVKIPDTDIYTAAFGYGKNEDINNDGETKVVDFSSVVWTTPVSKPIGQKWVQLPAEYLSTYGFRMTSYENPDQTDPSELLQETYDWLLNNLRDKTEYSIKAADLKFLGYETEEIRIGDTIGVDISILGIKLKAEILRYQENYLEPDKNDFELANYSKTFTSMLSSQRQTLDEIQRANQVLKASYIAGILAGWNDEINATSGFVYADPGSGIITYNALPDSATKVVEIKGGSIRIANSKIAGEWDWKTVMTGDGIIADGVYTGTLTGLTIRTSTDGDRLEMSAGSFKGYVGTTKRLELSKQDLRFYDPNGNYVGSIGADPDDILYRTLLIETPYSSEGDIYNNIKVETGAFSVSAVDTNGSAGFAVLGSEVVLEAFDFSEYASVRLSGTGLTVDKPLTLHGYKVPAEKTVYGFDSGILLSLFPDTSYHKMITIIITGNGYSDMKPIHTVVQAYYYQIGQLWVNYAQVNNGVGLERVKLFTDGGMVKAFVKPSANYQTLSFKVLTNGGAELNDFTLTSSTEPTGANKVTCLDYTKHVNYAEHTANTDGAQVITLGFRPKYVRITAVHSMASGLQPFGAYRSYGASSPYYAANIYVLGDNSNAYNDIGNVVFIHSGGAINKATVAFTASGITLTWSRINAIHAGIIRMLIEVE